MEHKINEWHGIFNQKDIDDLFYAYGGFHDSCITSVNFKSGISVDNERTMLFDDPDKWELHMIFHSQWNDYALELCFNGVRSFHLTGIQDNYGNDIFDASIKFYDNLLPCRYQMPAQGIVWADREDFDPKNIDFQLNEPADTYVIAHSLKWRLINK